MFARHKLVHSNSLRHRAATTGSTGFVALLLNPPEGSTTAKLRLNTGDRIGAFIIAFVE
jgi:hypothetical protein